MSAPYPTPGQAQPYGADHPNPCLPGCTCPQAPSPGTDTPDAPDALWERLWEAIATVRDASPRLSNDADTGDIVNAALAVLRDDTPTAPEPPADPSVTFSTWATVKRLRAESTAEPKPCTATHTVTDIALPDTPVTYHCVRLGPHTWHSDSRERSW